MAIDFPWEMFQQTQDAKNRNQQQMLQNISGMGQGLGAGLGTIGDLIGAHKKKQLLAGAFKNNPQLAPYQKIAELYPEQFVQNVLPKLIPKAGGSEMEVNPDGSISISGMPVPGQQAIQSQPSVPSAPMTAGIGGAMVPGGGGGGPPPSPRPTMRFPLTGNKAADLITKGMGGKPTLQQDLRQKAIDAMNKRTDVLSQRSQFGQIDRLARATGIQPQLLKQIQTNNVRADRALSILSEGTVYPQKLNLALIDLAGIMQGGAPQLAELHNTMFPTWQETAARVRLYSTGNPNTPVPQPLVDEVKKLVQGLKEVDNNYIRQNAQFQTGMIGPTIQGFQKNVAPVVQQGTERFIQGGLKQQGQYDSGKEARYQAWKKSHGL